MGRIEMKFKEYLFLVMGLLFTTVQMYGILMIKYKKIKKKFQQDSPSSASICKRSSCRTLYILSLLKIGRLRRLRA